MFICFFSVAVQCRALIREMVESASLRRTVHVVGKKSSAVQGEKLLWLNPDFRTTDTPERIHSAGDGSPRLGRQGRHPHTPLSRASNLCRETSKWFVVRALAERRHASPLHSLVRRSGDSKIDLKKLICVYKNWSKPTPFQAWYRPQSLRRCKRAKTCWAIDASRKCSNYVTPLFIVESCRQATPELIRTLPGMHLQVNKLPLCLFYSQGHFVSIEEYKSCLKIKYHVLIL